jgi:hypothetical protein
MELNNLKDKDDSAVGKFYVKFVVKFYIKKDLISKDLGNKILDNIDSMSYELFNKFWNDKIFTLIDSCKGENMFNKLEKSKELILILEDYGRNCD